MTELEILQKAVVDTKAAYDDAHDAWSRARLALSDYLKELTNDKV
tara:strand:+ start:79 stop:213 length:135 start_codon:yes stop_codon:yes gene_type:complete